MYVIYDESGFEQSRHEAFADAKREAQDIADNMGWACTVYELKPVWTTSKVGDTLANAGSV